MLNVHGDDTSAPKVPTSEGRVAVAPSSATARGVRTHVACIVLLPFPKAKSYRWVAEPRGSRAHLGAEEATAPTAARTTSNLCEGTRPLRLDWRNVVGDCAQNTSMSAGKGDRLQDDGSRLHVTAAGATAGLISRFVIAPLDVIKIRLQLQSHPLRRPAPAPAPRAGDGAPIYRGTLSTLRHILQHEGVRGLWKGNVPAELLYICYSAVQFSTYRAATQRLRRLQPRPPAAAQSFAAGALAGAAATAATYPLDLLRTRFAAQSRERVYRSLPQAVARIARDEGPRGFFRGLGPALAQIAPYMGLFFAVYEAARGPLARAAEYASYGGGGGGEAAAGMVASVVAKTGTFPLDLVRKRIQVQGPTRGRYVLKDIPEYNRGAARALQMILATEGIRGLYRGLTVSLVKAAPAAAVTMWTYERSLRFYEELALGRTEKKME